VGEWRREPLLESPADLNPGAPPTLSNAIVFATIAEDTPEFCHGVSDSHWPA